MGPHLGLGNRRLGVGEVGSSGSRFTVLASSSARKLPPVTPRAMTEGAPSPCQGPGTVPHVPALSTDPHHTMVDKGTKSHPRLQNSSKVVWLLLHLRKVALGTQT